MRVQRAKLKSRRDDMIIAQAQRRPGLRAEENLLFSPFRFGASAARQTGREKRGWMGVAVYPGQRPRRPCWAIIRPPQPGLRRPQRLPRAGPIAETRANQSRQPTSGERLSLLRCQWPGVAVLTVMSAYAATDLS
jgi:hypothetical protein